MHYLVITYIVIFVLLNLFAVFCEAFLSEPEDRAKPWENILDLAAAVALLAGMIFPLVGIDHAGLRYTWLALAPIAAGYILWSSWKDRRKASESGEAKDGWFTFADVATLILTIPALVLNLDFAL